MSVLRFAASNIPLSIFKLFLLQKIKSCDIICHLQYFGKFRMAFIRHSLIEEIWISIIMLWKKRLWSGCPKKVSESKNIRINILCLSTARIWISSAICRRDVSCVQWFVARCGCPLYQYWWNCWTLMFKLYFQNNETTLKRQRCPYVPLIDTSKEHHSTAGKGVVAQNS